MSFNHRLSRQAAQPSFAHLRRLTDDTGLLEHALGRIPRRCEGYTTDDNARALWTVTEWLTLGEEESETYVDTDELMRLVDIYLSFLLWAQDENGWWSNNFAYDRSVEPEEISHDCQGRSIWACADAWIRLKGPQRETARIIVERSLPTLARIDSLRGQAFAMAACAHMLEASQKGLIHLASDAAEQLKHHLTRLETLLNRAFRQSSDPGWRWFEPAMTYSNGVLPWAMLRTYRYTKRTDTLTSGLESLSFLLGIMTAEEGWLRPIGNEDWCSSDSPNASRWDQQPLEMFKLALALEEAAWITAYSDVHSASLVGSIPSPGLAAHQPGHRYPNPANRSDSVSRNANYYRKLRDLCRDWYYGNNDLRVPVVDPVDGSCCDGLTKFGLNINCGAESTLSYLMTEALCHSRKT